MFSLSSLMFSIPAVINTLSQTFFFFFVPITTLVTDCFHLKSEPKRAVTLADKKLGKRGFFTFFINIFLKVVASYNEFLSFWIDVRKSEEEEEEKMILRLSLQWGEKGLLGNWPFNCIHLQKPVPCFYSTHFLFQVEAVVNGTSRRRPPFEDIRNARIRLITRHQRLE